MTGHTAKGVPYALPTDALIDYPAASFELANYVQGSAALAPAGGALWGTVDPARPLRMFGGIVMSGPQDANGFATVPHNLDLRCYMSCIAQLSDGLGYGTYVILWDRGGWTKDYFKVLFKDIWASQESYVNILILGQTVTGTSEFDLEPELAPPAPPLDLPGKPEGI